MSGPQVGYEIVANTSKSSAAIDQTIAKTDTITGKLQNVGKGMVIGAGVAAFGLLTSAIDIGVSKLGEAHEAFLKDQESQTLLAQALQNTIPQWDGSTAAVEEYASAQGALGFADDDVRASLGQLVGVTHDQTEAMKLNSLAQDLARAKGIDLATATDLVTKAHEGNGKALKALGIDVAGAKTGTELLDAVQKNVNGSAATWAQTNTGKLAVSNVKVGEAMEKVGGIIDKASQVLVPMLADAFVTLTDIMGEVAKAVMPIVTAVASHLAPIFRAIGPLATQIFGVIASVVKALQPVFSTVFGVIGTIVKTLTTIWSTEFAIIGRAIGAFQTILGILGSAVSRVFGGIGQVVKSAINTVIGAVNGIIRAINGLSIHVSIPNPFGGTVASVDWNGPNLGYLPYLHAGGTVPGPPGADVLAILQAGERVTPASSAGAVTINIHGDIYGVDDLNDRIGQALRLAGATV